MSALREYVDITHGGSLARAKETLEMKSDLLDKWLSQKTERARVPTLTTLGPVMDKMGYATCKINDESKQNRDLELLKIENGHSKEKIFMLERKNVLLRQLLQVGEKNVDQESQRKAV